MSAPIIRSTAHSVVVDSVGRNDLVIGEEVTCTDVQISGVSTVVITCSSLIPAGAVVNYGWTGTSGQTGPGRSTGARAR